MTFSWPLYWYPQIPVAITLGSQSSMMHLRWGVGEGNSIVPKEITQDSAELDFLLLGLVMLPKTNCRFLWILKHQGKLFASMYSAPYLLPRPQEDSLSNPYLLICTRAVLWDHTVLRSFLRPLNLRALLQAVHFRNKNLWMQFQSQQRPCAVRGPSKEEAPGFSYVHAASWGD